MNLEQQLEVITNIVDELKAEDIIVLKVMKQSVDVEAMVIVTGRSTQHVRAIGQHVKAHVKQLKIKVLGIEGVDAGQWVLVDLAEVLVHVMTTKAREFYKLEKLWSD